MDFINQLAQGLGGFLNAPHVRAGFLQSYKCLPIAFSGQSNLEEGNKVILPASALDALTRLHIEFPMLFEITNERNCKRTHCGVMEFSAPEGVAYVPFWLMQNLNLENGQYILFRNVSLPKGTYVKFQPHETCFTELSNPRAVLEKSLRMYACLTKGDTISIFHGSQTFLIDIVEVRPDNAINIIEADVNVEFDPPKDYREPHKSSKDASKTVVQSHESMICSREEKFADGAENLSSSPAQSSYFANLSGGHRLNGKPVHINSSCTSTLQTDSKQILSSSSERSHSSLTPSASSMTSVVQGKWRYFYASDPKTHQRRLVKREPVNSDGVNPFAGHGYSLK